jgi:hypothetical protein
VPGSANRRWKRRSVRRAARPACQARSDDRP